MEILDMQRDYSFFFLAFLTLHISRCDLNKLSVNFAYKNITILIF